MRSRGGDRYPQRVTQVIALGLEAGHRRMGTPRSSSKVAVYLAGICLFCRGSTEGSNSREHVLPESLGNHSLVLPPGVVCDRCNNYFSQIERDFLAAPQVRMLRHRQSIPSKKGRIPTFDRVAAGHRAVKVAAADSRPGMVLFESPAGLLAAMQRPRALVLTEEVVAPPSASQLSRFLAKVALEFAASKLIDHPEGLAYLAAEPNLDPLRNHARRGSPKEWPVSVRRIYDEQTSWLENEDSVQRVWEACVFEDDEDFCFVLSIFGLELAIHLGSPDISGYRRWLLRSGDRSPLFSGANADDTRNLHPIQDHLHSSECVLVGWQGF